MDKSIAAVIKRFPQYWDRIRRLGECDTDFCSLCNDYFLAQEALNLWRTSKGSDVTDRVEEYESVVKELEAEIQQYLLHGTKELG